MTSPAIHIERLTVHLHTQPQPYALAGLDTLARAIATEPATAGTAGTAGTTQRFERSSDGTVVTDHKTGLQWASEESTERLDFDAAEKHCAALRLGGFDDWRLPDLEELESIRDLIRHEPCIDTAFFKSNSNWVWSRTPCAWSSGSAWVVNFNDGNVNNYHRLNTAFVRAVRRVSPAGQ